MRTPVAVAQGRLFSSVEARWNQNKIMKRHSALHVLDTIVIFPSFNRIQPDDINDGMPANNREGFPDC